MSLSATPRICLTSGTEQLVAPLLHKLFDKVQRGGVQQSWIEDALKMEGRERDEKWTRALAVGSHSFIERIQSEGGVRLLHRKVEKDDAGWQLREEPARYDSLPEKVALSAENAVYLDSFRY